jgi:hypothetical protein
MKESGQQAYPPGWLDCVILAGIDIEAKLF